MESSPLQIFSGWLLLSLALGCRGAGQPPEPPPRPPAATPTSSPARVAGNAPEVPAPKTTQQLPTGRVGATLCTPDAACILLGPVKAGKGASASQAQKVDATLAGALQTIVTGRVERYDDTRPRATQLGKMPAQTQCDKGDCLQALGRAMGFPFVARPELARTEFGGWGMTFYISSVADSQAQSGGLIQGSLDNLASASWLHPHLWVHAASTHGLPLRHDPTAAPAARIEWIFSKPAGVRFAKTETTLGQYRLCVEAGACAASQRGEDCNWERMDREDHPVNCVNGEDATAFCAWVGGRLPSDSEWFTEASDAGRRRFPWGGDPAKAEADALMDCAHAISGGSEGPRSCGRVSSAPVCSLPAGNSVSGLCDMSGNLWEWTSPDGTDATRERGGSWKDQRPLPMSVAAAEHDRRFVSWGELGFRCVRPGDVVLPGRVDKRL